MGEDRCFQDYYPEEFSHCYGCGNKNDKGLKIRSFWEGEEAVCHFTPRPEHMAFPGYVYGGLIASLVDCHCIGTAAAAAYRHEGREPGTEPAFRYVTGSLKVDYLKPTPLGPEIVIRARVMKISGRKTELEATVEVGGKVTARGRVLAVQLPEHLKGEV